MAENFINEQIRRKSVVTVYTTNGFQLRGVIVYDNQDNIIIMNKGVRNLVYKHAISTISENCGNSC